MKKILKITFAFLVLFAYKDCVKAKASLGIYASSTNVTVGSSVVITIKANDLAGTFNVTSSNSGILSGGVSNSWIENGNVTYIFKAKKSGKATVTVSTVDVSDFDTAGSYNASRSVTIKVSEPVNYSSNNYLKSLSVEGVDIGFEKEKTSYSVNIAKGIKTIKIDGLVDDSKATVSGLGEKSVEEGDNIFEVVVTAENGSTKTYKINAIVEEENPINVKLGKSEYRVLKKESLLDSKEGYEKTKIKVDGMEIPALKNSTTNLVLIGLKDNEGSIVLAVYEDGKYNLYKEITIGNLKLYQIEFPKDMIPSKYKKVEITYGDEILLAYQNDKDKNLYLIYAMNVETGKKNVYQYDQLEKTIQRYIKIDSTVKNIDNDMIIKIFIIIIGSIISFVAVTIKMAIQNKKTQI